MSSSRWQLSKRVPARPCMHLGLGSILTALHHPLRTRDMAAPSLLVPPNLPSTPPPARPGQAGSCLQCRQCSSAKPAWPVPPPSRSVSGQAAWERGSGGLRGRAGWRQVPWERFGTRRRHRHRSHPSPAPQSSAPPATAPCRTPSCWRRVRGLWGPGWGGQCPPGVPSIPTRRLSRRGDAAVGTCHPAGVPIPRGTRRGGGVGAPAGPPQPLAGHQPRQTLREGQKARR